MAGSTGNPKDARVRGVWFDLLPVSAECAELRGSEVIALIDVVKAIYVVDLEHVSMFWDDWRNFEAYLCTIELADGTVSGFINRAKLHLTAYIESRMDPGLVIPHVAISDDVSAVVLDANSLARSRSGTDTPATSCDILFCICRRSLQLSSSLQESGLALEQLSEYVNPKKTKTGLRVMSTRK